MTRCRLGVVALVGAVAAGGCAASTSRVAAPAPPVAPAQTSGTPAAGTAPTADTPALEPEPVETRVTRLAATVNRVLAERAFDRAHVAFVVRSLATNETLYSHNGRTWMVPASTMKVLTAVAAAERLGWGYRFETRLVAMGPIANGTLKGDLVVVGTGDPSINPRHGARAAVFDEWATTLRARGIRRITGRVVGDDSAVEDPGWGIGWAWDDLMVGYGAAYGALQFNDNEVEVTLGPGSTPGAPPVVTVVPDNHGLRLDVRATTTAEGTSPALTVLRVPGTRVLQITGRAPLGSAPTVDVVSVPNPTAFFVDALRAALVRHGITVDGGAVDGGDVDGGDVSERPRASEGEVVPVDLSPPLSELVRPMLQLSRNSYAETLMAALDAVPPATAADGAATLRDVLGGLGVATDGFHARDGSGLSRNDYLSADTLIETLTAAWASPNLRGPLLEALPEAGTPGTWADRLANTAAAGRVRAKTGSMSNVRALAGYVRSAADEPLAFAFISNGFDVRGREIDARVDELLLALVALPGQ